MQTRGRETQDNSKRYLIFTKQRMQNGQRPYERYAKSASKLAKEWMKRYGEYPVKIEEAVWNAEQHQFIGNPAGDCWQSKEVK